MELTNEELEQLRIWVESMQVGSMPVERPVTLSVPLTHRGPVETVLGGVNKLSKTTQRAYKRKAAYAAWKKNIAKNRKTPKGQRHWKSKAATVQRNKDRRWREQPLKCLVYGKGVWDISQEEWDRTLGKLWLEYEPLDLEVKRKWGKGTRAEPYTVYDLKVVHAKKGVVYSGEDQLIWDSSVPNALDIEKAPEGGLLFDSMYLSSYDLKRFRTVKALLKVLNSDLSVGRAAVQPKAAPYPIP